MQAVASYIYIVECGALRAYLLIGKPSTQGRRNRFYDHFVEDGINYGINNLHRSQWYSSVKNHDK
jgi:hypothetical protein